MKKPELHESKNYSEFIANVYQQPMSPAHVKRLATSMREHGYLPSKPIQCYYDKNVKKFRVIDGHHRLDAAEICGISFYYVVEPEKNQEMIGSENSLVRKWTTGSFINMYAAQGNEDYLTLQSYINRGISVRMAASMLIGQHANSGNATRPIQDGSFKVKSTEMINAICHAIDSIKHICPEISKRVYIEAISGCLMIKEFDMEHFIKKAKANPTMLQPASLREQALELIEDVYNYRNQNKINLAFIVKEVLKFRKDTFGRNT